MLGAGLDQRRCAVVYEFLTVRKGNDFVVAAVEGDRVGFDGCGGAPVLVSGAQEYERRILRVDVHRHCAATA